MQRWLPIVDAPFGQNADDIIGIQIDGIGVGGEDVFPEPTEDRPWTGPQKVFTARCAERRFETRVVDACGSQDLPGIGRPDYFEFALPVHLSSRAASMLEWCVIQHIVVCEIA